MKFKTIAAVMAMGLSIIIAGEVSAEGKQAQQAYQSAPSTVQLPSDVVGKVPTLTAEEFASGSRIYFQRCAGCHGALRKGTTGRPLTTDVTRERGTNFLRATIAYGTTDGMPSWNGKLTPQEIDIMARYIQLPPSQPPELGMKQMNASWRVFIDLPRRPVRKMNDYNISNFFVVTLRDAGQVALIDGDTRKIVTIVTTGYAVHISRLSASGRYLYVVGRDGKVVMIDLWMKRPDRVAEVKPCAEARSVETSKYPGWEDRYTIIGCYWPPQYVILDGIDLRPLRAENTRSMTIDNTYLPEVRVGAIVSSRQRPEFVLNLKEAGKILLVDYSDLNALKTTSIYGARFLHDGGWDASRRYFMAAASKSNIISVVDTRDDKLVRNIAVGKLPHPGRGANVNDRKYGPLWVTGHLGDDWLAAIGTDPVRHPTSAWKVVRHLKMQGTGNLFVKTHPASNHLWVDSPLNPDGGIAGTVAVFDLDRFDRGYKLLDVAKDSGVGGAPRVLQPEYNRAGDEVWLSVWNPSARQSAIVIYDDKTLAVKAVIKDRRLRTVTGKFNVYNTQHDIY